MMSGRVAECAEDDTRIVADLQSELASEPVGHQTVVVEAESGYLEFAGLEARVVRRKEPQAVPQQRPARAQPDIIGGEIHEGEVCQAGSAVRGESSIGEICKPTRLKLIAAGKGHHVDDAIQGLSELRLVSTLFDLDLLNEVVRKPCAGCGKRGVGDVHPIDEVHVLQTGRSADVHTIPQVATVCLGEQRQNRLVVAVDGQRFEILGSQVGPKNSAGRIDGSAAALHHYSGEFERFGLEPHFAECGGTAKPDVQVLIDGSPISNGADPYRVQPYRQAWHTEAAVPVGRRLSPALERGPVDSDTRRRKRLSVRGQHVALESAGDLLRCSRLDGQTCHEYEHQ